MSQSPSKADFLARSIHRDTPVGHIVETRYGGYLFRSRVEARWAVFFDAINVTWDYELEKYTVYGRKYLPDFYVRSWQSWIEIKPDSERDFIHTHVRRIQEVKRITHSQDGYVVLGAPNLMNSNLIVNASHCYSYFSESGPTCGAPNEFVTLAYRKAMEERFESRT